MAGALLLLAALAAAEVVVVTSSDLRPYQEVLAGFREAFKGEFTVLRLSDPMPRARVVVAIGGKAAIRPVPAGAALVYALSPGVLLRSPTARVAMVPRPEELLDRIRRRLPRLESLGVLHGSPAYAVYARDLAAAAKTAGVAVRDRRVRSPRAVPSTLRTLAGRVEALWVAPDPLVINAASLEALRTFSWDHDVPLFFSSPGLAARGAAASIHVRHREVGRLAARAAQDALDGRLQDHYYGDEVEEVVNEEAAREAGLEKP